MSLHPGALSGAVGAHLAVRIPIDLVALDESSSLRRRFDSKFLLPFTALVDLFEHLGPDWQVLEVDGARSTHYRSTYFDTPDLRCYRDHLMGRRRRFKARTRRYGDGDPMLELKLKGAAGRTVKTRWPLPGSEPDRLDDAARVLVAGTLNAAYGMALPHELQHVLTTRFERVTLANPSHGERLTIDMGLTVENAETSLMFGSDSVIVETKADRPTGLGYRLAVQLGHRPLPLSKYCIGVAALRDDVRGNPWLPALRRLGSAAAPFPV